MAPLDPHDFREAEQPLREFHRQLARKGIQSCRRGRRYLCAAFVIAALTSDVRIEVPKAAVWCGDVIDGALNVAVVCVARAGIFPSQVCYDFLNKTLKDFIYA